MSDKKFYPKEVFMSANLEAKKVVVEEIKTKIQASESVVVATYNKLTVAEATALRRKITEANAEYKVYKNTLIRKAFNELGVTAFDHDLNGTTAVIFAKDEVTGAKVFAGAIKENPALEEKLSMKSAYVDGAYVDKKGVEALAAIPARDVLLARMVGSLLAPVSKLVYVLDAISQKENN